MTRLANRWLLILVLLWVPAAPAAVINLSGIFSGLNESPPNASPGTGFVTVLIDTIAHLMTIHAEFSGLLGNTTAAHIHCCTVPGSNAGVATTVPSFAGFPLGVTSGTFNSVLDLTAASTYNPAFVAGLGGGTIAGAEAALLAGLFSNRAYFNIHTNQFPGGEIRANLRAPEPSTLVLLGVAALAAGALRRRRG
ncbi:MAG: CHRD domain-containing protein [Sphingomicrobium sp.]